MNERATILIVEDNAMIQEIMSERLKLRGYDVLTASNGEQAVETAVNQLPNLILMDISLPIMDGWQATEALKSDSTTAHIPIIALTAHALVEDKNKSLRIGCDEFETKPINMPQLLGKIETLLAQATKSTS